MNTPETTRLKRTFGRDVDGDSHGRHALVEPGGDNRQRDVLHVLPFGMTHPTRFDTGYIGKHRRPREASHFIASLLTSGWAV